MAKPKTPQTPPSSSELDAIAAQCTQMVDGTAVTLSRSELRQYTAHRRDEATRAHRAKREKLAALRGDRVSARTYKAIQRQLDRVQRWYKPRRIRVGMAPETMPKVRFKKQCVLPPTKLQLPSYGNVIVDRNGRVGVFVDFKYDGAKHNRFGVIRRRIIYQLDPSHCEKDDEGRPIATCDFGVLLEEICAGADLWELAQRESRVDAQLCKNIIVQLPHDVSPEVRRQMMIAIGHELFGRHGLPYVGSVHEPDPNGDQRNYHAHFCGGLRPMTRTSYGQWDIAEDYRSDLDGPEYLSHARRVIADILTRHVITAGIDRIYTHESNAARGLPYRPQRKLNKRKTRMGRQGEFVADVEANREIIAENEAAVSALAAKKKANAERRQKALNTSIQQAAKIVGSAFDKTRSVVTPRAFRMSDRLLKPKSVGGGTSPVAQVNERKMERKARAVYVNEPPSHGTVSVALVGGIVSAIRPPVGVSSAHKEASTPTQIRPAEAIVWPPIWTDTMAVVTTVNQPIITLSVRAMSYPATVNRLSISEIAAPTSPASMTSLRSVLLSSKTVTTVAGVSLQLTGISVQPEPVAEPPVRAAKPVQQVTAPAIFNHVNTPKAVTATPPCLPKICVYPAPAGVPKAYTIPITAVSLPSAKPTKPATVAGISLPVSAMATARLNAVMAEGHKIAQQVNQMLAKIAWQRARPRSDTADDEGGSSVASLASQGTKLPKLPPETQVEAALKLLRQIPQNKVAIPILQTKSGAFTVDLALRKTHKLTSPIMGDGRVQTLLGQIDKDQREELRKFIDLFRSNGSAEELANETKAVTILPNEEKAAAQRWAGTQAMEAILRIARKRQQAKVKADIEAWLEAHSGNDAQRYRLAAIAMRQCKRWAVTVDVNKLSALKADAEKFVPPNGTEGPDRGWSRE